MPIVALPDGREVEFPEGASPDFITGALRKDFPQFFGDPVRAGRKELLQQQQATAREEGDAVTWGTGYRAEQAGAFGNLGRGVAQVPAGTLKFAGTVADAMRRRFPDEGMRFDVGGDQSALTTAGEWIEQQANRLPSTDPEALDAQFQTGIGQLGGMMTGGALVGKLAGKAVTRSALAAGASEKAAERLAGRAASAYGQGGAVAGGFGQEFSDAYERAGRQGDDPDTALAKSLGYASVATMIESAAGAGRLFRQYFPSPQQAQQALTKMGVSRAIAGNFLAGYGEEASQRIAQNVIVEPGGDPLAGAHEEGRVGALVQGLVGLPAAGRGYRPQPTRTVASREVIVNPETGGTEFPALPAPSQLSTLNSEPTPTSARFRGPNGEDIRVDLGGATLEQAQAAIFRQQPGAEFVGVELSPATPPTTAAPAATAEAATPAPSRSPYPEPLEGQPYEVESPELRVEKPAKPAETNTQLVDEPVRAVPAGEVTTRADLMQFKRMDESKSGVNEGDKLAGQWDDRKAGVLLLWEPLAAKAHGLGEGQRYIVANGHHRFEFGERAGRKGYNAQVLREADGFSASDARRIAAEVNIADGKGTVYDQAKYFRNTAATLGADAALAAGRRIGARGRTAADIGIHASDDLFASFVNEQIPAEAARAIATAAPVDAGAQRIGITFALQGKPPEFLANVIKASKAEAGQRAESLDLFGADDSAMKAMAEQAERASGFQKELRDRLTVLRAGKKVDIAKSEGIDVKNPEAIPQRIEALKGELVRWENWPLQPDLVAKVKGEKAAVSAAAQNNIPSPPLARALEIESKFGLEPADAHFFNVALDAVATNPSKWTSMAEGVQKEALRAAVAAGGNLTQVGDLKLARRIATLYLREASAGAEALPVSQPKRTARRTDPPTEKSDEGARETGQPFSLAPAESVPQQTARLAQEQRIREDSPSAQPIKDEMELLIAKADALHKAMAEGQTKYLTQPVDLLSEVDRARLSELGLKLRPKSREEAKADVLAKRAARNAETFSLAPAESVAQQTARLAQEQAGREARSVDKAIELMTPEEVVKAAQFKKDGQRWGVKFGGADVVGGAETYKAADGVERTASMGAIRFKTKTEATAALHGAHKRHIENRIRKSEPVSAASVDAYSIKLPDGYLREGDRYVFKPQSPADFSLAPAESVAQQTARLAQEQAGREAQAAKDKLAQEAAAPLTGNSGDIGQGDLFKAPEDLFAPPQPGDALRELGANPLPEAAAANLLAEDSPAPQQRAADRAADDSDVYLGNVSANPFFDPKFWGHALVSGARMLRDLGQWSATRAQWGAAMLKQFGERIRRALDATWSRLMRLQNQQANGVGAVGQGHLNQIEVASGRANVAEEAKPVYSPEQLAMGTPGPDITAQPLSRQIAFFGGKALLTSKQKLDVTGALQAAAVKKQSDNLWQQLVDSSAKANPLTNWRLPNWMIGTARARAFKTRVLHVAARLNATGRDATGNFTFNDFTMRAGTMSLGTAKQSQLSAGDRFVVNDPLTGVTETLTLGPVITTPEGRIFHQLERPVEAGTQKEIYDHFNRSYPEMIWLLDMFIDPALAGVRQTINGIEVPVFNRFAAAAMMADGNPNFSPLTAYTPDVLVTRSLIGSIRGALSFRAGTRSPGRKYKSGTSREGGHVRDLLSGFNVRSWQMLQEKARREWMQAVLKTATPIQKNQVPEGWVKLETGMEELWQAVKRLRNWQSGTDPVTGLPLFPETEQRMKDDQSAEYKAFFLEAMKLRGKQLMLPKALVDQLVRKYVAHVEHGTLFRLGAWLVRNSTQLFLVAPVTVVSNVLTNDLFTLQAATRRILVAVANGRMQDARFARELFTAEFFKWFPGLRTLVDPQWRAAMNAGVLPENLFADQTMLADLKVRLDEDPLSYLRQGEIGAAALQFIRYGSIDVRAKTRMAYAWLRAQAVTNARKAGLRGNAQRAAVDAYLANPPVADLAAAVEVAGFELLNYADSPAWLEDAASGRFRGLGADVDVGDFTRLVMPFPRFGYHYIAKTAREAAAVKVLLGKVPKGQRADAFADLITFLMWPAGGLGLLAAYGLKGFGDDDDEARKRVGTASIKSVDDDGNVVSKPLPRDLITSNRINLSAWARGLGLGTDREEDFWLRVRSYPVIAMAGAALLAEEDVRKFGAAEGAATYAGAVKDLASDFFSVGMALKAPAKVLNDLGNLRNERTVLDPYAAGVPTVAYVVDQTLDSFVPGSRQFDLAIKWLDPIQRRRAASKSLAFHPGVWDSARVGHVTGLLDRLFAGQDGTTASTLPPEGKIDRRTGTVPVPQEYSHTQRLAELGGINLRPIDRSRYESALSKFAE